MHFVQQYSGVAVAIGAMVVLALAAIAWWHYPRSNAILKKWAEANGYRILEQQYRLFLKVPYTFSTADGQTVFYVTVQDKHGAVRRGWVRCGGWWLGLWSDKVQVK
jgi:hypothetical protein